MFCYTDTLSFPRFSQNVLAILTAARSLWNKNVAKYILRIQLGWLIKKDDLAFVMVLFSTCRTRDLFQGKTPWKKSVAEKNSVRFQMLTYALITSNITVTFEIVSKCDGPRRWVKIYDIFKYLSFLGNLWFCTRVRIKTFVRIMCARSFNPMGKDKFLKWTL